MKAQSFIEVTEEVGIALPQAANSQYGNGACVHDWNNDGWDDIVITSNGNDPQFYQNDGDGTFTLQDFNISNSGNIKQLLMADYDNDGDSDIIINRNAGNISLYVNEGGNVFVNNTQLSGLEATNAEGFGAALGDYDNDGWLDLYISNYDALEFTNFLYRNLGDGTFSNETSNLGVGNGMQSTFQSVFMDHNRDGWADIFVANDRTIHENTIYENSNGIFSDLGESLGINEAICSMSATVGDFDNDADLDIYVTNSSLGNILKQNEGDFFLEVAQSLNCSVNMFCWGSLWIDFDNDSWKDLFVCTQPVPFQGTSGENILFKNLDASFTTAENSGFEETSGETYATAMGDFNNDGFMDIITHSSDPESTQLFYNEGSGGHYIKVSLEGVVSNKDAIGSFIEVWADDIYAMEYLMCGESYLAQHSQYEILGLGSSESIDSLKITWPSGLIDCIYDLDVDQTIEIIEGQSLTVNIVSSENLFCMGESLELSISLPGNVTWSTGDTTASLTVEAPGTYWADVITPEGFTLQTDTTIVDWFPTSEFELSLEHIDCQGDSAGIATIQYLGGSLIDSIMWSNGMFDTATNLPSGFHTYTLIDEHGCSYMDSIMILEPAPLMVSIETTPPSCFGDQNGAANIDITGGTSPYDIDFFGFDPNQLAAGEYEIAITDSLGCMTPGSFEMTEPEVLEITLETTGANDGDSGTASVDAIGGTPPYSISWNPGPTDVWTLDALGEGSYTATITDSLGCSIDTTFLITSTTELAFAHFEVWPNPFSTWLQTNSIGNEPFSLDIYAASGKLVWSQQKATQSLNLSFLDQGMYLFRFTIGRASREFLLIKQD